MKKNIYIAPRMKVIELESTDIICISQYDGGANQSLDDIDIVPSEDGTYRPVVIFD